MTSTSHTALNMAVDMDDPRGFGQIKCPQCGSLSKNIGMASRTLIGWSPGHYDEDGKWVANKDPNTTTQYLTCRSCGHEYFIKY